MRFFVLLIALTGCTTVHIHDKDAVSVSTRFGITSIQVQPTKNNVAIIDSRGLGLISTPRGVSLGWVNEAFVSLPEHSRCLAVLWVENRSELEAVLALLNKYEKSLNNICVLNKGEFL